MRGIVCDIELTGSDFERIRREHLRGVRIPDFARVWLAAEQRADALKAQGHEDGYVTGVVWTCRWIADDGVRYDAPVNGRRGDVAPAPASRNHEPAYEELIDREAAQAEAMAAGGRERPGLPGYVSGVTATFAWTWRWAVPRSSRPSVTGWPKPYAPWAVAAVRHGPVLRALPFAAAAVHVSTTRGTRRGEHAAEGQQRRSASG
ncbi:hypothetical protein [Kribbella sp. NPDC055071]